MVAESARSPLAEWRPSWYTRHRWLGSRSFLKRVLLLVSVLILADNAVNFALDPSDPCGQTTSTFNAVSFWTSFVVVLTVFFMIFVFAKLSTHDKK